MGASERKDSLRIKVYMTLRRCKTAPNSKRKDREKNEDRDGEIERLREKQT